MARRKNTAEAYEILLRIAEKEEQARRKRDETKEGPRSTLRSPASGEPPPRGGSPASRAWVGGEAFPRRIPAGAGGVSARRGPPRDETGVRREARPESSFPRAAESRDGAAERARPEGKVRRPRPVAGEMRKHSRARRDLGRVHQPTRPRGDLAAPSEERVRRQGGDCEAAAEEVAATRALGPEAARGLPRPLPLGQRARQSPAESSPAGRPEAASGREPEEAGGVALEVVERRAEPPAARSRLPEGGAFADSVGHGPDPQPDGGSGGPEDRTGDGEISAEGGAAGRGSPGGSDESPDRAGAPAARGGDEAQAASPGEEEDVAFGEESPLRDDRDDLDTHGMYLSSQEEPHGAYAADEGADPDFAARTGGAPPERAGAPWRRIAAVSYVAARQLLFLPLRFGRWVLGESAARFLARPVEVRVSTLIMSTISLVIVLSLIGIYLNRDSGQPFLEPGRDEGFEGRRFSQAPGAAAPERAGGMDSIASSALGHRQSSVERGVWTHEGDGDLRKGPEIRNLESAGSPGDAGQEFNPENWWVRLRSNMDEEECADLIDFLRTTLMTYLESKVDRSASETSIAHKELVYYPMPAAPDLYWVFVGPFARREDARHAIDQLQRLTGDHFVFRDDPGYFARIFALQEGPSIVRHRSTARRSRTAALRGPPRG